MQTHPASSLTVRIADIPIHLQLDCGDAIRAKIAEDYAAFAIPDSARAFSIRIREEAGGEYIPLDISDMWQIRTRAQNGRIEFESYFEKGWADRVTGRGELIIRPRGDPENFLRVLYAWLCLDQAGLLLHAAGVISENKGYVFFGPSGSGKTTVARLSLTQQRDEFAQSGRVESSDGAEKTHGAPPTHQVDALPDRTVLSDDLVIIKKRGDLFWLYGVPFRGDFQQAPRVNADAELSGVFALVKDRVHRVESLALPEAIARISACVPFIMSQPQNSKRVLSIAAELAASVSVRALHFSRDAGFWEAIRGFE